MSLATGLDTVHVGDIVSIRHQAYFGNGLDPCQVWDGIATLSTAVGYPTYTGTPSMGDGSGGSITAGVHGVRLRYKSAAHGYIGTASTSVNYTAPGSKKMLVDIASSGNAKVDSIVVEMTTAAGAVYYEALVLADSTGTATVNLGDTTLAEFTLGYDHLGHIAPPVGSILLEHRGVLITAGPAIYSEGTANIASLDTVVTGKNTAFKAVMGTDNWWFTASGDTVAYEVKSFGNAGTLHLRDNHATFSDGAYKLWSPRTNKVYFSKPLFPESFGDTDGAYREYECLRQREDQLRSIRAFYGDLIFFGEHSMERFVWELDAIADGRPYPVPGDRGACGHHVTINIENILYSLDRGGWFRYAGGTPESIDREVFPMLDRINWSQSNRFHAVFNAEERLCEWWVCTGTNTEPDTGFCYRVDDGLWKLRTYAYGPTASDQAPDSDGRMRPFYCDENGYTWFEGIGGTDGAHPTCDTVLTLDSGCTTLTLDIASGTLHVGTYGIDGVGVHWVEGNESGFATSNDVDSIYLASAFSSAPGTSDTVYLGRIKATHKTKAFRLGGPGDLQQPFYLHLDFVPVPISTTIIIRMYENFSVDAKNDWLGDSTKPGVATTPNNPDILVDISQSDGHIEIPLGEHHNTFVEFEIEVDRGGGRLQLLGYYVEAETERLQET